MNDQNPTDSKRMVLFIALSVGILFTWQNFFAPPHVPVDESLTNQKSEVIAQGSNDKVTNSNPEGISASGANQRMTAIMIDRT